MFLICVTLLLVQQQAITQQPFDLPSSMTYTHMFTQNNLGTINFPIIEKHAHFMFVVPENTFVNHLKRISVFIKKLRNVLTMWLFMKNKKIEQSSTKNANSENPSSLRKLRKCVSTKCILELYIVKPIECFPTRNLLILTTLREFVERSFNNNAKWHGSGCLEWSS